ncbi:hypothetical protein QYF36_011072 [Acer negundo]|nr:hypothetical protein QYF36_011072 [Acer negundo]
MVVVHGDCGRNLNNEAGYVMDPMYMEASLFIGVSFDLFPLKVPRSRPSSQVGYIEALFGSISTCAWVDPLVGTGSHSDKGYSNLPSHANSFSSTKGISSYADIFKADPIQVVLVIDLLVQTISSTMGPFSLQRPLIPYAAHRVRKDYYGSSQIPFLAVGSTHSSRVSAFDSQAELCLIADSS